MNIEYEEFSTIEDIFLYMSAASPPMKNTIPINSYRGFIVAIMPLSQSNGERFLMMYVRKSLEPGLYEFDIATKSFKTVELIERADKTYFIVLTPKSNTIADRAIDNM